MKYYELITTVMLKKDLFFDEINWRIGQLINQSIYFSKELRTIHKKNEFKYYVFSALTPIEKEKVYKNGNIYIFRIKSIDENILKEIKENFVNVKNNYFHIISKEISIYGEKYINNLYTLNAAICTKENIKDGYWKKGDDLDYLRERITKNIVRKYKNYYGELIELKSDFIEYIEILNRKPIVYKYKDTKILGNKFNLKVSTEENAQKLAFLASAVGILEKGTSLGAGYCIAK